MAELDGRTAIVTGAARGIGRAIAEKLAAAGADLALCDLKTEWLEETAEAVRGQGRRAELYAADVSDPASVQAAVTAIQGAFDRIDILWVIRTKKAFSTSARVGGVPRVPVCDAVGVRSDHVHQAAVAGLVVVPVMAVSCRQLVSVDGHTIRDPSRECGQQPSSAGPGICYGTDR